MFLDLLTQELGIYGRMQGHKRCAKTGAESCLRFDYPLFSTGDFGSVAREKMVHRLLGGESGDGGHYAKGIGSEKDDVGRMASYP